MISKDIIMVNCRYVWYRQVFCIESSSKRLQLRSIGSNMQAVSCFGIGIVQFIWKQNMSEVNDSNKFHTNATMTVMLQAPEEEENVNLNFMTIISAIIAAVGVVANLTVVLAFARHRELRQKVPVIFVINQVSDSKIFPFNITNLITYSQANPNVTYSGTFDHIHLRKYHWSFITCNNWKTGVNAVALVNGFQKSSVKCRTANFRMDSCW